MITNRVEDTWRATIYEIQSTREEDSNVAAESNSIHCIFVSRERSDRAQSRYLQDMYINGYWDLRHHELRETHIPSAKIDRNIDTQDSNFEGCLDVELDLCL